MGSNACRNIYIKVLIAVLALFLFNIDAKAEITFSQDFNYTGNIQEFVVPYSGQYKIEVWGAQGGARDVVHNNFGAYSVGSIQLIHGNKIYIGVGGQGGSLAGQLGTIPGGYNGGGSGKVGATDQAFNSGGGATHMALGINRGELKNYDSYRDELLIVAGGGGSSGRSNQIGYNHYQGSASAGGISSTDTAFWHDWMLTQDHHFEPGGKATQTSGNAFGQGYSGYSGGGGGYYGGGHGGTGDYFSSGGSSYIGNPDLTDKQMVCYNCTTSDEESTKTVSTTLHSASPISNYAKDGSGYAKVTLLDAYAYLNSLVANKGTIEETFEPNLFEYTWIIPKGVSELTDEDITAIPNNPESTVIIPENVLFTQDGDTFEIIVIDDNTDRNTYTLRMQRYVSNDGRLASITSDKGKLRETFDPDKKDYTLEIFEDADSVILDATAFEQDNQGITGLGEITLTDYEQDTQITSTAEDGTIEVYNIHIIKDMYLKNIEIEGLGELDCGDEQCYLNPSFDPGEENYKINVPYEYDKLNVTYVPSHEGLMVGIRVNNKNYSRNQILSNIKTTIKFNVYRNDNSIVKTYTVVLKREKEDEGSLKELTVNKGHLVETFKGNKYNYTWVIPKGTTTLTNNDVVAKLANSKSLLDIPSSVQYTQDGDKFNINIVYPNVEEFSYNGSIQEYIVPFTGLYKLETWGAQGGARDVAHNNFGAYSVGTIELEEGNSLYIGVGGQGGSLVGQLGTIPGGYNGGGSGKVTATDQAFNSGGGATHIALEINRGELKYYASNTDELLIVSGGGGSSGRSNQLRYNHYQGSASAGGISSADTAFWHDWMLTQDHHFVPGGKATQTSGNAFGQGYSGYTGGGGGYYGGGHGGTGDYFSSGGSSYIGNPDLTDKHMTCYACTTSNEESTKTIATTLHSATPKSDQTKEGNGFAKITLLNSEEGTLTKTYTLTLQMEKSDDARLATLTATTPTSEPNFPNEFDKDQTDPVIIEVYNNVFEITLDGTPYEQDATVIDGLGTIELNEDEVEHNITVQAENGDIRVYQVIIRKNMYIEDMGLTSTSLEGKACKAGECVLEPTFDPGTTEYFIKVPVDYDNLYAYYSLPDTHHTSVMTVDGNPYVDGYELPVEGTVVVKVDVYNDDPNNNQVVKTYTMRVIKEVEYQQEFDYTGDYQVFIAPFTGKYKMETWGAQGENDTLYGGIGGKGAYTSGYIILTKGEKLYVYVGSQGNNSIGGYNGGGSNPRTGAWETSGGGATDIRLKSGSWDNDAGLASRIMVSGGGAGGAINVTGGAGGALNGIDGISSGPEALLGHGGTQTAGGTGGQNTDGANNYVKSDDGSFGKGGNTEKNNLYGTGGGSGYYGGGGSQTNNGASGTGGGGSSFISGHPGAVAITAEDDLTPKTGDDSNVHYSGKVFTKTVMIAGNQSMPTHDGTGTMTGNSGNGYAKITYIPEIENRIDYDYTGDYQEFVAPTTGLYKMENWGAQGANDLDYYGEGGKGAYTSGYIRLHKGEKLYIYVGQQGNECKTTGVCPGGYNGGGNAFNSNINNHNSGGGATDIRLSFGEWNEFTSLSSRIMVAAGGGGSGASLNGGAGGALTGFTGTQNGTLEHAGRGGTQTSGGAKGVGNHNDGADGSFGKGADQGTFTYGYTVGGGSGYYGGGSSGVNTDSGGAGGGGSSFISGHPGVNAIAENSTESNIIHTGQANHYSGKVFTDTVMKAGNELMPSPDGVTSQVGNNGDGHAAITLIEVEVKLDDLTVDYGALTESFDKDKNDYVWQIPKDTEYIDKEDIHYVPSNPDSTVTDTLPIDEVHNGDVIEITVTGDDGVTTNVYTLTVEYIKDTDNRLRILESDKGVFTPEFNPDTNSYVLEIYEYLDEVTLTGEPMSEYSTVSGLGTIDMEEDIVEHEIIVTAEDGTVNIYNVTIKKDAYLLYLGLSGLDSVPCVEDECTLVPPFEPSSNEYSIKVPYEYETLDVYYLTTTLEHSVKIKVNNVEVSNYSLPEGDTLVTVELYNKNNILVNTYTMNVNRSKGNYTSLETLEVSEGDLNVPFRNDLDEYTWILPDNISTNLEDYISYTTTDPGATVELVPSSINYTREGSKFDIKVTAEDGVTTKTYTINLQQDIIEDIEVNENMLLATGQTKNLYINGLPEGSEGKYLYEVDQNAIIWVDDYGDVFGLFPGEANITISIKNHPEIESKVVHVTVIPGLIESDIYDVTDKLKADNTTDRIVIGAEPLTTILEFKDNLINDNEYIYIYDLNDNLLSDDDIVKTGLKIKLILDNNTLDEAIMIVRGDIDGDGYIDVTDEAYLMDHILEINEITGYKFYAADLEEDGLIDVSDEAKLMDYILEIVHSLN